MKKRGLRRAGLVTMVALAATVPGVGGAEAEVPRPEPRQIIAILIGVVKDHPEFSGEVESKHDISKCVSNVPVQILKKNSDGMPSSTRAKTPDLSSCEAAAINRSAASSVFAWTR